MKKITFTFTVFLLLCSSNMRAERFELSVLAGAAVGFESVPIYHEGEQFGRRSSSFAWGLQGMYNITDRAAVGLEFLYQTLARSGETNIIPFPYMGAVNEEVNKEVGFSQFFISARINLNPSGRLRFYLPLGAGLAVFRESKTTELWYYNPGEEEDKTVFYEESSSKSYTKPAFYGGLGAEFRVSDNFFIALEGRYNTAKLPGNLSAGPAIKDIDILMKAGLRF